MNQPLKTVVAIGNDNHAQASMLGLYAKALAMGRGDLPQSLQIAEQRSMPARVQSVLKAAVAVGTTTDTTWAKPLVDHQIIVSAFVSLLRNSSVFYRALDAGMVRVPFNTQAAMVTAGATAYIVNEGAPVPVSRLSLAGVALEPKTAAAMLVVTEDLIRSTSTASEAMLSTELRRGVTAAVDTEFFALITDGSTPTQVSSGTDGAAALADLRALLDAVEPTAESRLMWVMAPDVARQAATLAGADDTLVFPQMGPLGGVMLQLPAMVSDQMAPGTIGLLDMAGIAGESDTITIDASNQASVQMDSTPTNPPVAGTVLVSMWQHNMVSILAKAYFGVERLRTNAWAFLSGVQWG